MIVIFNKLAVKADTLSEMIEYMTDKVGLVHQMPFTCDREGFSATFEKVNNRISATIFFSLFPILPNTGTSLDRFADIFRHSTVRNLLM